MTRHALAFGLTCVLAASITAAGLLAARGDAARAARPTASTAADRALDPVQVRAGAHIAFLSTALGPTRAHLAFVPLTNPGGPRSVGTPTCERAYSTRGVTLCLTASRGAFTTYGVRVLDGDLRPRRKAALPGIPSRGRLNRDGTLAGTTSFVSGHSYAVSGFSTVTRVTSTAEGGPDYGNLEEFAWFQEGQRRRPDDVNVWGVTFAAGPVFYATVASGGRTYLVRGDLDRRSLTTVRANVECPSVSPDGDRLAYKTRPDPEVPVWRLAVLDLATGRQSWLAETRSADDQVEWLDAANLLYGIPGEGGRSDVWAVPADGTGKPRVLIPDAWSPSVVPDPDGGKTHDG